MLAGSLMNSCYAIYVKTENNGRVRLGVGVNDDHE